MRNNLSKITLLFVIGIIFYSCSLVKRVPEGKLLLTKNEIYVNDKLVKEERINNLVVQKPNNKFLTYPLRLSLYNLAKKNPDSSYQSWLNKNPKRRTRLVKLLSEKQIQRFGKSFVVSGFSNFLKKTGEPPVIIDEKRAKTSQNRLSQYHYNMGYFDNKVEMTIDTIGKKRGKLSFNIATGSAYIIDSISKSIESKAIDSLYETERDASFIKKGEAFQYANYDSERKRITQHFRNNGVYHFQENFVKFDNIIDEAQKKLEVVVKIEDRSVKEGDLLVKKPFNLYTISQINIFTDNSSRKGNNRINDSTTYRDYTIYSFGKLDYKPKAITNAIFIEKGKLFSDNDRTLTSKSLSNLKVFYYPTIEYIEDTSDTTKNALIANIYLLPRKKMELNVAADFSTSDIQDFGITGNLSLTFRNVFRRAETLQLSTRGNIGSSKDLANPKNVFFNISEYGLDAKLSFPRIFFPLDTRRIIRKEMLPTTNMNFGFTRQTNIGLDKENFTSVINYNWTPKEQKTVRFDLFNMQYIRNLNVDNYFNVYRSSYDRLNELAQDYNYIPTGENLTFPGAITFIDDAVNGTIPNLTPTDADYRTISSIGERRKRLIENNLIVSSSITFSKNTKSGFLDNNFYSIKAKVESAGNFLSLFNSSFNEPLSSNGNRTILGVEYAQYIKTEFELVKHWDFGKKNTLAMRTFAGIAIPYGNANSIPFSKSYFSGGSNDNRGWQPYSLGPGRSGGINDFNEANFKLAYSTEFRFRVGGNLFSALFVDVGNIWNVFDNVEDERYTFNGLESLKDLAVGSGIGFRYDFNFFVFRFDLGYKAYDPAREMGDRWLKGVNFGKTVLNFGINYPF